MSRPTVRNVLLLIHVDSCKRLTVSSISPRTFSGNGSHLADICLVTPGCLIYWTEVVTYFKKSDEVGKFIKLNIIYFIFHTCLKCKSVEIPFVGPS